MLCFQRNVSLCLGRLGFTYGRFRKAVAHLFRRSVGHSLRSLGGGDHHSASGEARVLVWPHLLADFVQACGRELNQLRSTAD
jgi:hypothetical protein